MHLFTDLVLNPKAPECVRKDNSKVDAGVGLRKLYDIKHNPQQGTVVLEVHGECHHGLVVGRGPAIRGEIQLTIIFLRYALNVCLFR